MELASVTAGSAGRETGASSASQTLGRGLDVLEEVAAGPAPLNEIARRLGLSRSTVHRLAASLIERRYLTLAPRRGYSLGPKLLELGSRARGQIGLVRAARPFMDMLAEQTGDAVLLVVRDGDAALLADCVLGARPVAPRLLLGDRQDLLRSAAGRALLLDVPEAALMALHRRLAAPNSASFADFLGRLVEQAALGVTLDDGVPDAEILSMAAPVRGADGSVRGALGIALAATYQGVGLAAPARETLCRCAETLSRELGWTPAKRQSDGPALRAERELLGSDEAKAGGDTEAKGRARVAVRRGTARPAKAGTNGSMAADGKQTKGRGA